MSIQCSYHEIAIVHNTIIINDNRNVMNKLHGWE